MNPLTHLKKIRILTFLIALAFVVLTAAPVRATPPSPSGPPAVPPYLITEIISKSNVGELDINAKTDIDPTVATHFWKLRIDSMRATDLYVVRNTFQPGATSGWHTHPGPSLITVTAGAITAYDGNCTPTVYGPNSPAGASFIDIGGGEVHLLRNEGNVDAVTVVVQFIPHDFPRRIDAPNPGYCPNIN